MSDRSVSILFRVVGYPLLWIGAIGCGTCLGLGNEFDLNAGVIPFFFLAAAGNALVENVKCSRASAEG